ncbi:MAG: hypothetical protein JETCAE01_28000 [Anaerolineaceae bacterium]|nr:MAG: hypothetical protein JETCAE01_28000 [Anaerolineaceae bacterium]
MPRKFYDERTRKEMIDPQLETAGWYLRDHSKVKIENILLISCLQEEFVGMVARVESLPVPVRWGRGRMSEAGRQVEGLFEVLLSESFGA